MVAAGCFQPTGCWQSEWNGSQTNQCPAPIPGQPPTGTAPAGPGGLGHPPHSLPYREAARLQATCPYRDDRASQKWVKSSNVPFSLEK